MSKIPPSELTKKALDSLLAGGLAGKGDPRSEIVRLSVQHLVEQALEAVVHDVLGRDYYARRDDQPGSRNGYRRRSLKTAEGSVEFSVPQVRDISGSRIKELADRLQGRTEELETLAVEMWAGQVPFLL
ncbi:MAG: hypothetical protein DRH37_04320 [Deltaproteobacteria bacterium]|nr:MAG: hypothetical protein DRH37_04320 [Deltaproteobacteria bacterium]